jgi:ABC-2 type transport system permease protein
MTVCIGFIGAVVVLEAGPVYSIFMSGIRRFGLTGLQWLWIAASFSFVLVLCTMALVIPMRLGEQKLSGEDMS